MTQTNHDMQHNFWVVRSAGSDEYNFDDAILRDVVSIGAGTDEVTIRFVVCLNPRILRRKS